MTLTLSTKTGPVHVHDTELYQSCLANHKCLYWLRYLNTYSHVGKLYRQPNKHTLSCSDPLAHESLVLQMVFPP